MDYLFTIPSQYSIDLAVSKFLQGFQADWFLGLMQVVTFLGNPLPGLVLLIAVTFLVFVKDRKAGSFVALSTSGAVVISMTIKHLVSRERPIATLVQDSFPSGHVLFYVGLFGFLLFLIHKKMLSTYYLLPTTILLAFIGISRIYLGYHWFSDVLGAYIIGFLWLVFVTKLYNGIKK